MLASSSKGNCYRIADGYTPLLLECGIPYKEIQRQLNFKTSELAGCLITHEHKDHCKSIKDIMKSGIDCYLSQGTVDSLQTEGHRLNIIRTKHQFKIRTWTILPFDIQHDSAEPLGFLLADSSGEKLLYATDTYYIKYKFNGLTHIMIECNHSYKIINKNVESGLLSLAMKQRLIQSHFSLENVKKFLLANDLSKVQGIWLIHLSAGNSNADQFKQEIKEVTGKPVYIAG